jgi:DNA-binding MarR family transcriptional regulator
MVIPFVPREGMKPLERRSARVVIEYGQAIGPSKLSDVERIDRALGQVIREGLNQIRAGIASDEQIPFDLSTYEVLARVVDGAPIRVSDLAPNLGLDASTVSRHAFKLAKLGFIERRTDIGDRRVVWLEPTSEGERLVAGRSRARRAALQRLLATWTRGERESFVVLLEKFFDGLEEDSAEVRG